MSVGETLIKVPGRVLSPMNLKCLNNNIFVGDQGNWTDQLRQLKMLETPYIEDWVVLAPSKYFSNVKKFVITLRLTAERMALHLPEPEMLVPVLCLINCIIIKSTTYLKKYNICGL